MLTLSVPIAECKTGKYSRSFVANESSKSTTLLSGASFIDLMQSPFNFFSRSALAKYEAK